MKQLVKAVLLGTTIAAASVFAANDTVQLVNMTQCVWNQGQYKMTGKGQPVVIYKRNKDLTFSPVTTVSQGQSAIAPVFSSNYGPYTHRFVEVSVENGQRVGPEIDNSNVLYVYHDHLNHTDFDLVASSTNPCAG